MHTARVIAAMIAGGYASIVAAHLIAQTVPLARRERRRRRLPPRTAGRGRLRLRRRAHQRVGRPDGCRETAVPHPAAEGLRLGAPDPARSNVAYADALALIQILASEGNTERTKTVGAFVMSGIPFAEAERYAADPGMREALLAEIKRGVLAMMILDPGRARPSPSIRGPVGPLPRPRPPEPDHAPRSPPRHRPGVQPAAQPQPTPATPPASCST